MGSFSIWHWLIVLVIVALIFLFYFFPQMARFPLKKDFDQIVQRKNLPLP